MIYVLVAWVVINILIGFCIVEEYSSPYDAIREWWRTATETVNFMGAIIWVGAGTIFILPTIIKENRFSISPLLPRKRL